MPINWPMLLTVPTMLSFHFLHIIPNCVHQTGIMSVGSWDEIRKIIQLRPPDSRRLLSFFQFRQTPICCTPLWNWHRRIRDYTWYYWQRCLSRWYALNSGTYDICKARYFRRRVPPVLTSLDCTMGCLLCRTAGFRIFNNNTFYIIIMYYRCHWRIWDFRYKLYSIWISIMIIILHICNSKLKRVTGSTFYLKIVLINIINILYYW